MNKIIVHAEITKTESGVDLDVIYEVENDNGDILYRELGCFRGDTRLEVYGKCNAHYDELCGEWCNE
jgi:hypothetical protein